MRGLDQGRARTTFTEHEQTFNTNTEMNTSFGRRARTPTKKTSEHEHEHEHKMSEQGVLEEGNEGEEKDERQF